MIGEMVERHDDQEKSAQSVDSRISLRGFDRVSVQSHRAGRIRFDCRWDAVLDVRRVAAGRRQFLGLRPRSFGARIWLVIQVDAILCRSCGC